MKRILQDAARAAAGRLIGEDRPYGVVSTDSRTLPAGALFVALRGPKFDGADFVAAAHSRGAVGALVERAVADVPLPQIEVPDALKGLQRLGRAWRDSFSIPIVGVGGSNGKTTAKEMTSAILSRRGPCMATHGNLNNHIGVPVTLMRLEASHRSAVIEMGANRIGDVAELVALARPTVGFITNAGAEHLEGFGDLDGVARGEGEMVSGLVAEAPAIINADDTYADYWRGLAAARRVITFGLRPGADFTAAQVVQSIERGEFATRFTLKCPLGERPILLKAGGAHNVSNALGASAAASAAGASLEDIALGLAEFRAVSGRLQLKAGLRDSWIIDDSYNANPSSVRAGLEVLRALSGAAWLVLADMAELGEHTSDSHAGLGRYARDCGVRRLFAFGPESSRAVETFGSGGEWFADVDSLIRRLQAEIAPGVTVLIKGSRVNRLERVVQALVGGTASWVRDESQLTMLLYLTEHLAKSYSGFHVFQYLTLRGILAAMTALALAMLIGPRMISALSRYQIGQRVRTDGPQSHLQKSGTPTMGGGLILVSMMIATLLWADLTDRFVWILLGTTLAFGGIGFYDDYLKLVVGSSKGLAARYKYFGQSLAALCIGFSLHSMHQSMSETTLYVPFFKTVAVPMTTAGFVAYAYFVIVGTSNAVNLTDGLDGLAIMPAVMVAAALGVFAYATGNFKFATYLQIPYITGAGEVLIFCAATAGAGLGFLWFNSYPAEVFMGDVGALAIGAALGTVAVIVREEIVLFVMGGVFVLETVSVILQVASFKLTGRRIFRMAPLHHHFELKGWSEPKVIVRFWIISFLLVLTGLATLKIR